MLVHHLKTLPEFFEAIASGVKKFEVRKDDCDYGVADILVLEEWSPEKGYTGRHERRDVDYILRDEKFGVKRGFCIMSISKREQ